MAERCWREGVVGAEACCLGLHRLRRCKLLLLGELLLIEELLLLSIPFLLLSGLLLGE